RPTHCCDACPPSPVPWYGSTRWKAGRTDSWPSGSGAARAGRNRSFHARLPGCATTWMQEQMMRESPHSRLQALARTPDQVPPDALWQRLRAGQRRAVLRRRLAGGATASALALLLVAVLPWPLAQAPTAPAPASVATHDP